MLFRSARTQNAELGVHILGRQQTARDIHQGLSVRPEKTDFSIAVVHSDPVPIPVVRPRESGAQNGLSDFSNPPESGLDLGNLGPHLGRVGQMLGGATSALPEKRTRRGNSVGGWGENFQQLAARKRFVSFGDDHADFFPGGREGNKNDLPIMPGNAIASIGDFRNDEIDRTGNGRSRMFQYQLSFKSAGGRGSTCPVS